MPKGSSVTLLIKIRDYFHTRQTPMTASKSKKYPDYKDTSAATSYRQGLAVSRIHGCSVCGLPWLLVSGDPCRNDGILALAGTSL
jgi:hypothetical protein